MNKLLLLDKAIAAANAAYRATIYDAYTDYLAIWDAAHADYNKAIDAAAAEYHESKEVNNE